MKSPRARIVALAVGVGVLSSVATAPASFAAGQGAHPPAVGTNCQTDGKISGRGSTFQTLALNSAFISGYNQDICGPVGTATNLNGTTTDPAGANMLAYNYSGAASGSGAGLAAISCRTDPFDGTDLPYNNAQLTGIDGAPGAETGSPVNCPTPSTLPPFGPVTASYPNTSDQTIAAMNFPVAGGAVALAVNMNGVCATVPTSVSITSDEMDKIWQGTINKWNDPELIQTDPILTTDGCTGSIQRVVRYDTSGTTAITKTYLNGVDSGPLCDGTASWASIAGGTNTAWPLGCHDVNGNVAPAPVTSGSNGSPSLITKLENTSGGIGYSELGLWGNPLPAGVSFALVESHDATVANGLSNPTPPASSFLSSGTPGAASNCQPGANGLPGGGTTSAAVGLGGTNANWSSDASPQKENITYAGSGYPVCGLTFDFVYTGMHNETGEVAGSGGTPGCTGSTTITGACQTVQGPFIGLTNDQLRTLYSFFTYVFSPLGQSYLDKQTYDELPAAWLPTLRAGYQDNY